VKKEEEESQANADQTDDLNRMNVILSDVLQDRDTHLRYLTEGGGGGEGRRRESSTVATQTTATPATPLSQSPISPILGSLGSLLSNTDLMQHLHQQLNPPVTQQLSHRDLHGAASLFMSTSNPQAIQQQQQNSPVTSISNDSNNLAQLVVLAKQLLPKGKPSSFRGITRRKKRWEAHVWRHGKQQYLGGYKEEEAAARAYDKAVIKIRGREGETNFPSSEYVEEMKRLRADELTVDEFILVLREEAKKRSKQLKEEEEDRRIAMLKQLNEGDVLKDYLSGGQHPSASALVGGKRERSSAALDHHANLNLNLAAAVASSQGLGNLKQINTEAILDSYLEMTREAKRQKRDQEKAQAQSMARSLSLAQYQSGASVNVNNVLSSLLQQQSQQGGGASTSATATGTSPITPNLTLGGVDPQQLMQQMLSAESLLLGQQQQSTNTLILQALAQQQQRIEQQARSHQSMVATTSALVPQILATRTGKVVASPSSSPPKDHKVTLHTLPNVPKQSAVPSITPPSSDAGSITVSDPSN
jgi:hypothetical protein